MTNTNMPKFLALLFFAEMWERFSYYGMRALLVLFLISELGFEDAKAYAIYSLFCAIGYAGPVISGYLADKFMGFKNMVVIGGIFMTIGNGIMTLVAGDHNLIYLGLGFVAIGTGMFKGNITSLLGSCYKEGDRERDKGFTLFYVSVNIGSFLSSIICGYVAHIYGWQYGFGLAGVGMAIGTLTFLFNQHILGESGASPRPDIMQKGIFGLRPYALVVLGCVVLAYAVSYMLKSSETFAQVLSLFGGGILCILIYIISKLSAEERRNMMALMILIFFLMCFFALEMQLGSLINVFTDRNVAGEVFGITIPAAVSQALNPLSVIILGGIIGTCMKFNQKYATMQCAIGLCTMVVCFLVLYIGCVNVDETGKVEYIYLVVAMAFMGLGELCIVPMIQAQTTLLTPKPLRGFMMGVNMLFMAFANLLGIVLAKFMSVPSVDGEVNTMQSLLIYKDGFLHITAFNLGVVAVFMVFFPFLHSVITRK